MKKVKHPHRKALIRQKYQKRKPKMNYNKCWYIGCEQCPLNHAYKFRHDKNCYVYNRL